jgi:hypothetical protein
VGILDGLALGLEILPRLAMAALPDEELVEEVLDALDAVRTFCLAV